MALAELQTDPLPLQVGTPCVWCKSNADKSSLWISVNGVPRVPLCLRCHNDVERVAQALIVFGRFVLPRMTKK